MILIHLFLYSLRLVDDTNYWSSQFNTGLGEGAIKSTQKPTFPKILILYE
jgi:hypothetical protein